ncbi:MAG: endolytic transglycosylase MltG [Bacillota bacterium]|jgi:UPF0755 protein
MTDNFNNGSVLNGKKTQKRKMKKSGLAIIIIVLILIAGGVYYGTAFGSENLTEEVSVEVPDGAGAKQIGDILAENGIVKHKWSFVSYVKKQDAGDELQPGTYTFGPGKVALSDVVEALKSGGSDGNTSNVTIPEGLSVEQIAETFEAEGIVDKQTFLDAAAAFDTSDYDYIPGGDAYTKLEGFLFPETYNVMKDWDASQIISMMLNQFDKVFTAEMRQRAEDMGYSVYEIVTMASIVEREALFDEDRPVIAGVFYNRLDMDMKLQSCATVQYILGEPKTNLTNADVSIDDPYNTYMNIGLPPGPIAAPGESSLQAALYPEDTDYMYFVAMPDGHHSFSTTYEEHLAAKEKYLN